MNDNYFITLPLNDLNKCDLRQNLEKLNNINKKAKELHKIVLLEKEANLNNYSQDLAIKEYKFLSFLKLFGFNKLKSDLLRLQNKKESG